MLSSKVLILLILYKTKTYWCVFYLPHITLLIYRTRAMKLLWRLGFSNMPLYHGLLVNRQDLEKSGCRNSATSLVRYSRCLVKSLKKKKLFAFSLADLKKTLAVLLDNIMLRLGKLESKVENIYNGTGGNLTNSTSTATPSATNSEKVNVAGMSCLFLFLLLNSLKYQACCGEVASLVWICVHLW